MKYAKLIWHKSDGPDGYAFIKCVDQNSSEVKHLEEICIQTADVKDTQIWGIFIYGSRAEYDRAGMLMSFSNYNGIEEVDEDWVMEEHFVGLL